jgi:hypothetical protein
MPSFPIRSASIFAFLLFRAGWAQPGCPVPIAVHFADEGGPHVAECSALSPSHYPPTSGPHYPVWANPGVYAKVINPGYWLHAMEHGAVVFLVNCHLGPDCQADFDRLRAVADAFPEDSACVQGEQRRIIIAGDTLITTRFAAVAWNWSMGSECFDSSAFAGFLKAHYNRAPEDICGYGSAFPGAGGCNAPLALIPAKPRAARGPVRRAGRIWPGLPGNVRPDGRDPRP